MDSITVVPAYGADYTSQAKVKEAWSTGKDFRIVSYGQYQGAYVNREDAIRYGMGSIMVRYAKQTKIVSVN